jgi:hypothetical protein
MNVDPLAIEAHEKGERETDTIHTISLTGSHVVIVKQSRVNNDTVVELTLNQEKTEYLPPGNRVKRSMATSDNPQHLQIASSLMTVNGLAQVLDIKRLVFENDVVYLRQELTIWNEETKASHTTTRYFLPHYRAEPE